MGAPYVASEESFTTGTRPSRSDLALGALLTGAACLLYLRPEAFGELRRAVLALTAVGLLFASPSRRPLRLAAWLAGVALVVVGLTD